ncbi:MAG TPA: hypothetical protein VGL61_26845 [Kofleriaceae bacterium]|jgi:hypothetical protein
MTRHVLALMLAAAAGCSTSPDSGTNGNPHGTDDGSGSAGSASSSSSPRFLSFGTNVSTLTENQELVFSAVLTDPDGIDDLIGGTLQSADGKITYGSFATADDEGAYSLSLAWGDLQEAQDISFKQSESRVFMAVFFDAEGNTVDQQITVQLTCDGRFACSGTCEEGGECSVAAYTPQSCDAVCATLAMTCDSTAEEVGEANYQGENVTVTSCSAAAPTTDGDLVFDALSCACIPNN